MTGDGWPRVVRVWEWSCRVIEAAGDHLWAEVVPQGGVPGMTVHAKFNTSLFPSVLYDGDVFTMTSTFTQHSPDTEEARTDTVALVSVRPWTAEEIDAIRAEAEAQWAELQEIIDPTPEPRTSEA